VKATTKHGPIYVLSTHIDLQHRLMSVLAREIDECARELRLREKSVSLHVARCYLIESVAQDCILNMMIVGKVKDIERAALYMGQRAAYGVAVGGYLKGEEVHGKETGCDREEGVPALRAYLVAADGGVPDEVLEMSERLLVEAQEDPQEHGTVGR